MQKALAREAKLLTIAPEKSPKCGSVRDFFIARKAGGLFVRRPL